MAIVALNPKWVVKWTVQNGMSRLRYDVVCKSEKLKIDVMRDIERVSRKAGLGAIQVVSAVLYYSPPSPSAYFKTNTVLDRISRQGCLLP